MATRQSLGNGLVDLVPQAFVENGAIGKLNEQYTAEKSISEGRGVSMTLDTDTRSSSPVFWPTAMLFPISGNLSMML